MSINFKRFLGHDDTRIAVLIVIVGCVSFALGRFSVGEGLIGGIRPDGVDSVSTVRSAVSPPVTTVLTEEKSVSPLPNVQNAAETTGISTEGAYVASKGGTKYHLPWCSGAQRIKEENKVWFSTKAEAEAAGYSPAANCKGI